MPATIADPPASELIPTNCHRVWSHPELDSHSLLVLTRDCLVLAPFTGTPRPELVAAAVSGADLDELLGSLTTVIHLGTVRRLTLDLVSNAVHLEYAPGTRLKSGITLTFATSAAADSCFSRIWRRLGDACKLYSRQRDGWSSARMPLMFLAAILAATAVLGFAIHTLDELSTANATASVNVPGDAQLGGPMLIPQAMNALIGWMDWRAVCACGGAGAAASQVWLYRRITQPLTTLEVIRS